MGGCDTGGGDRDSDSVDPNYEQKCDICKMRFKSESAWSRHVMKRSSGCEVHQTCFASDNNLDHAREKEHTKCFVKECVSYFAHGYWPDGEIVDHVKEEHTNWGSSSSSDSE